MDIKKLQRTIIDALEDVKAQDIHLSQFYTQDHLLNPARVGDHTGDYRISVNYRNQWRSGAFCVNIY